MQLKRAKIFKKLIYQKIVITGLDHYPNSTAVYIKLNGNIEWTCQLLEITIVKLTSAGVLIPPLLITAVNYFIYDLKDESYYLVCPVM